MLKRLLGSVGRSTSPAPSADPSTAAHARGRFIAFVVLADRTLWVDSGQSYSSQQASMRLRTIVPAKTLSHHIPVAFVPLQEIAARRSFAHLGTPHAVVIGKLSSSDVIERETQLEALLDWLDGPAGGLRVFADLSDDYEAVSAAIGHDYPARYQRRLLARCEVIVPCAALAKELAVSSPRGVRIIEDPYESPRRGEVRFAPGDTLKLLWFGNVGPMNAVSVERALKEVVTGLVERRLALEFVTSATRADLAAGIGAALRAANPRLDFRFVEWSRERTWDAMARSDVVLLPQDSDSAWGRVKSHNRLVESIWRGRFAVASAIPSYVELADFAWVGDDLAAGVRWAIANPEAAISRMEAGQRSIEGRFAPEVVGRRWCDALDIAERGAAGIPAAAAGAVLRLNLGCGDKILDGYVNVDVAASRAGKAPDVQCDLRRLTAFADEAADEVMAIHVVEHFWRWEVLDVLKEWVRVLKPGGRMVLECPNLLTACEELLRDPAQASATDQAGQRTMWVLYGDPRWQDPLMTHRWNYTPQSLRALMEEAGLVHVRQEPAQFKLREPRDMRVVGEKARGDH